MNAKPKLLVKFGKVQLDLREPRVSLFLIVLYAR